MPEQKHFHSCIYLPKELQSSSSNLSSSMRSQIEAYEQNRFNVAALVSTGKGCGQVKGWGKGNGCGVKRIEQLIMCVCVCVCAVRLKTHRTKLQL